MSSGRTVTDQRVRCVKAKFNCSLSRAVRKDKHGSCQVMSSTTFLGPQNLGFSLSEKTHTACCGPDRMLYKNTKVHLVSKSRHEALQITACVPKFGICLLPTKCNSLFGCRGGCSRSWWLWWWWWWWWWCERESHSCTGPDTWSGPAANFEMQTASGRNGQKRHSASRLFYLHLALLSTDSFSSDPFSSRTALTTVAAFVHKSEVWLWSSFSHRMSHL